MLPGADVGRGGRGRGRGSRRGAGGGTRVMDLQAFLSSTEGIALQAMLGLAFADFVLGVIAAGRDGTFELEAVAAFLRKHILGRVTPIGLLLIGTYYAGGIDDALGLGAAAVAAAG